jgi:hypothetical protein
MDEMDTEQSVEPGIDEYDDGDGRDDADARDEADESDGEDA